MKFYDLLLTASSNMFRSKARTLLTIIAILIGAMTITLTNGIGTGIKSYLDRQLGNLGATNLMTVQLTNKNSPTPGTADSTPPKYNPNQRTATTSIGRTEVQQLLMSQSDVSTIESVPNITSVVPSRSISPDYIQGSGDKYQITVQQQFGNIFADMAAGHGVDNTSSQNEITIPYNYVSSLGYASNQAAIGQTITIGITSSEGKQSIVTATITGVEQRALIGGGSAFINTPLANELYGIQSTGLPNAAVNSFTTVVATFPGDLTASQIATVKDSLSRKGYTGQTIKDREDTIFTVLNSIIIVFDGFAIITLLAASFGIVNTLFMSVQERTKEIGLMKALGMSPRRIFFLFSIEAVLIGFWGSALGVILASLLGNIINAIASKGFLKDFPGLSLLTFPPSTIVVVIIGIMFVSFLAGTLPALRASRKDPIEALRYE